MKEENSKEGFSANPAKGTKVRPWDKKKITPRGSSSKRKLFGFSRSSAKTGDVWDVIEKTLTYSLRERARERRWKIFFRLVYLLIFLSVLVLVARCQQLEFNVYKEFYPKQGEHLALIQMKGIVASGGGSGGFISSGLINDSLRRAFENKNSKAIFLSISSPGGSPVHSGRIYDELMRLRAEYPEKKVYAVVDELAASAAYHIASATDEIYADDSSLVGSIGIISGGFGFEEAIEKLGLERRLYTSGENKAFLDPFAPVKPKQEVFWQQVLDALYDNFVADVKRGRGDRLSDDPDIFSGYIYNGERALELGLIDGLGSLRSVARDRTGMDNFVDYSPKVDYLNRLLDGTTQQLTHSFYDRILRPAFR